MYECIRTGNHVVRTVEAIFPYFELGKNLKLIDHREASGRAAETSEQMQAKTLGSYRTLKSVRMICHYVQTDAILNYSRLLDTDGRPDRKFSSSERMLLTEERPEGIPRRSDG
jgi:hypothetical protein